MIAVKMSVATSVELKNDPNEYLSNSYLPSRTVFSDMSIIKCNLEKTGERNSFVAWLTKARFQERSNCILPDCVTFQCTLHSSNLLTAVICHGKLVPPDTLILCLTQ